MAGRRLKSEEINRLLKQERQKVLVPRIRKAARVGDIPATLRLSAEWAAIGYERPAG